MFSNLYFFDNTHPLFQADNVLEVCIAKYWSNYGEVTLRFNVKFHGVATKNECKLSTLCTVSSLLIVRSLPTVIMHSANAVHKIEMTTLSQEEIYPIIALKNAVMVLKPSESKITALTNRDILPTGRQIYQNILTFNLHLSKPQEVALYAPMFYKVLYESEYESQFWMLFDSNKQLLLNGDAYSNGTYSKLEKGDYLVKLQVSG
jgi:tripeptidyl-peptidase II